MPKSSVLKKQLAGVIGLLSIIFLTAFGVVNFFSHQEMISANLLFEENHQSFFAFVPEADILGSVMNAPVADEPSVPQLLGSIGDPVSIQIPSIAVDAPIEKVALTKDGSMDAPHHPFDTGWYDLGPRPGEIGSAAIAGHLNWKDGSDAIFANLTKVKPGDSIAVKDDKGQLISFMVREIRKFGADADATDVFSSKDGKAHLNIITCNGVWDKQAHQYSQRLVVFADKE